VRGAGEERRGTRPPSALPLLGPEGVRRLRPSPHAPQTPHQPPTPRLGGSLLGGLGGIRGSGAWPPLCSLRSLMRAALEEKEREKERGEGTAWQGRRRPPLARLKGISAVRGNPVRLRWGGYARPKPSPSHLPLFVPGVRSLDGRSQAPVTKPHSPAGDARAGLASGPVFAVAPLPQPPLFRIPPSPPKETTRCRRGGFALSLERMRFP
jgi:hypothetical protein